MLYAILSPQRAQLKFGWTESNRTLALRVRALFGVLLVAFDGDRNDERSIHRALDASNAGSGEWHRIDENTLTFLGRVFEDPIAALEWAHANPACRLPAHVRNAVSTRRRAAALTR